MAELRPLQDRVLIKRTEALTESAGGIIIPTTAQEESNRATVVAVGPGLFTGGELVPCTVEVGMTVLIGKWAGDVVGLEGVDHLLVRESDIVAILD